MKTIQEWITEYGESHQNPINKAIHWVCVPLIMLSLLSLISLIPFPFKIELIQFHSKLFYLNWSTIFLIICVIFYLRLSVSIALGMLIIAITMILSISIIEFIDASIWKMSILIFILAWIGQFIGHKIEGKKPSFFEDIQFLFIGPAWLLSFIYKKVGIRL